MNLAGENEEHCTLWCQTHLTPRSDLTSPDHLTWTIPTTQLYRVYTRWCSENGHRSVKLEDFWGILQILYPATRIIGPQGNRAFTNLRLS